ncbi:MAG TPA: TonB family protein [Pyrinomonadaceae bacterium]|nr:TonB family protein [Pyrinomonadaceae bacterium]
MKQSVRRVTPIIVAIVASLWAGSTSLAQVPKELDSSARARIEQSRSSIVIVRVENESGQPVSQGVGFFIRNDLVATDIQKLDKGSRVRVAAVIKEGVLKVLSAGTYFLPYVLLEKQLEVSPLRLSDSERVAVNDSVYMVGDQGAIAAGTVTGTTTMKDTSAFLISIPINSGNKGAPVFDRHGDVIGIAAESADRSSAGLAFPSSLLAHLKHLGEPGVGAGRGDGPAFSRDAAPRDTEKSVDSRVDTKPVRLSGPTPKYTQAARASGIQGTVTLRVLVGEGGDVRAIRVVRGLPDGLTEQAIEAARQTKFKAASKDGQAVAYWVVLQLEFTLR